MEKLRVAFIGTGRISDLHALAYLDDERTELVSLCDNNIGSGSSARAKVGHSNGESFLPLS